MNEELLRSHLHATILSYCPLASLNKSIGSLLLKDDLEKLPLHSDILEALFLAATDKARISENFRKTISDEYFQTQLIRRKPSWFNQEWINKQIDGYAVAFDAALDRWRVLYRSAQTQIKAATSIIENRIYADDHEKKKEAYKNLRQAERQRDLLLNDLATREQSEFYPYRYLAAEGFLPGYNFTRLPARSFMENNDAGGEYISRPRFIALTEFGPNNIVYHNGSKYQVNRMILTDTELKLQKAKISAKTGYFLFNDQYGYEVDPITNETIQLDASTDVHTTLLDLSETRAKQMQRINCQEEERSKKGYDIKTHFAVDDFASTTMASVKIDDEAVLRLHYFPTCRIYKLNLKWRIANENGYSINVNNGYFKRRQEITDEDRRDEVKTVKLFTSDTANAIYIQPVRSLKLENGSNSVITLMYALKRAIENFFQVESNEIGATIMGEDSAPNIFIYESAEGSLGILSQIVDNPVIYKSVIEEAYRICFFVDDEEQMGSILPATYDDLLSYYNQYHHLSIDRNLIREALQSLRQSTLEVQTNKAFDSYEEQYQFLQAARDPNSSTEEAFLKYLYKHNLKLPDVAQPNVEKVYTLPDFLYKPNIYIYCDGIHHDEEASRKEDLAKRTALKSLGYRVLVWNYKEPIEVFVSKWSDVFKKIK
jgi:very-short-patch-repair endonuclease